LALDITLNGGVNFLVANFGKCGKQLQAIFFEVADNSQQLRKQNAIKKSPAPLWSTLTALQF
jgi:hypothetical protein